MLQAIGNTAIILFHSSLTTHDNVPNEGAIKGTHVRHCVLRYSIIYKQFIVTNNAVPHRETALRLISFIQ